LEKVKSAGRSSRIQPGFGGASHSALLARTYPDILESFVARTFG